MPKPGPPDVVRISSPGDVVCAVSHLLGFVPSNSVTIVCLHGERRRIGLALRFGFELAGDPDQFALAIGARVRAADATDTVSGVFLIVFTDQPHVASAPPHRELVEPIRRELGSLLVDALLVVKDRWWSYLCDDPACCPPEGGIVDNGSPGAMSVSAAHALRGRGVLPTREAVIASIAYRGTPADAAAMAELIDAARDRQAALPQSVRRATVTALCSRLSAASHDPRADVSEVDAAELAALCEDVVVRDEVLVRARKPRRRITLLRVLGQVVQRVPSPYDAPVCAVLAWIAYAAGDGVVANVAIDRALDTDPTYSLATLIDDALARQIPPRLLEEVMRDAARDLRRRSAAG